MSGERATFLHRINNVDRRLIFLLVFVVVSIPMLLKLTSPVQVSAEVKQAYDFLEAIPAGGVVLISIDYDATSMPELQPMLVAMLHQFFRKNLRVLLTGELAIGLPLGMQALEEAAARDGKTYGVDYVNLGYRPGQQAVIVSLGREIRDLFAVDYRGTPLDQLPLMKDIHNYDQMAAVVALAHGATPELWIQFAQARYGVKIVIGTTAVGAPDYYNYLQAKQLVGLLGGMRGAAEYETLEKLPGLGLLAMPAQSWVHLAILGLIVMGNVTFVLLRRAERRR
ncbi:MAG: hypothetical protein GX444_05740 [Myxococcales bacterium]|nr:hypothetical protein [Myxococcales bacterium]